MSPYLDNRATKANLMAVSMLVLAMRVGLNEVQNMAFDSCCLAACLQTDNQETRLSFSISKVITLFSFQVTPSRLWELSARLQLSAGPEPVSRRLCK
jgi:hypothetical protein